VGGFNGFAWINVVGEQQLSYMVPGPAQCEVIVPVEVVVVVVEINLVSGVHFMFRNRRFLRLIEPYVSLMFLASSLYIHPVWPMYTFLHSEGIRYTPGILRPKSSSAVLSNCLFLFFAAWTVLILYFVKESTDFVGHGLLVW
jgi:hypothetical protein